MESFAFRWKRFLPRCSRLGERGPRDVKGICRKSLMSRKDNTFVGSRYRLCSGLGTLASQAQRNRRRNLLLLLQSSGQLRKGESHANRNRKRGKRGDAKRCRHSIKLLGGGGKGRNRDIEYKRLRGTKRCTVGQKHKEIGEGVEGITLKGLGWGLKTQILKWLGCVGLHLNHPCRQHLRESGSECREVTKVKSKESTLRKERNAPTRTDLPIWFSKTSRVL